QRERVRVREKAANWGSPHPVFRRQCGVDEPPTRANIRSVTFNSSAATAGPTGCLSNVPAVGYTRGNDSIGTLEGAGGIGGLLARSHGYAGGSWSTHSYYHADGGGNVTYLINSSQAMVASYRYDPYGRLLASSGGLAGANVMRFSSKPWLAHHGSASDGLYYYGYRFYDPNLQRWLNRDPLGDRAFKKRFNIPVSRKRIDRNLYHFVFNEPVASIDPYGLDKTPWPYNGGVCNCANNSFTVCVLIDGDYYTLPAGQCTASGNMNGGHDDVDGYWLDTTFYKIETGFGDACKPDDECKWNWNSDGPNSPSSRGAKLGDTYPDGCGPIYVPPPLPRGPIRTGP
ncbi:MAG: RHS repeat-associated core domain-containing protein, partial [Gemmatales bacterium]|nr:RHS repeat-associated core domain-containing protein [Gemmatales bacterium]